MQNVYLIERICGICSFIHAMTYSLGIEKMMNVQVPKRADYLRVIWGEIHRVHSHLLALGLLADSFGFENLFMQIWRIREDILDIMEETSGGRVMLTTCQIGGTRRDISPELLKKMLVQIDKIQKDMHDILPTLVNDYTVKERMVGVGVVSKENAQLLGGVGPVARASGIEWDTRMLGYAAYGELGFKPVVETAGDCYARTLVRIKEMDVSLELVRKAIQNIPDGPFMVPVKGNPTGEVISRCEQPRGEVFYYLKANGTPRLERMRVRTPTFANIAPLIAMLPGNQLADVPVIVLSIDPCVSCTER